MHDLDRQPMQARSLAKWVGGFPVYGIFVLAKALTQTYLPADSWHLLFTANIAEWCCWMVLFHRCFRPVRSHIGYLVLMSANMVYTNVPLFFLALGLPIFPFSDVAIRQSLLSQSLLSSHLFLFLYMASRRDAFERLDRSLPQSLIKAAKQSTSFGITIASALGLVLALIYLNNFYASGVSDMVGVESRIEIAKAAETGKIWLLQYMFMAWLMTMTWIVGFAGRGPWHRWQVLLLILPAVSVFLFAYLQIGNRRELAAYFVFLGITGFVLGQKKIIYLVAAAFPALLVTGSLRSLGLADEGADLTTALNVLGEFIFPHYPLIYYADTNAPGLLYGLGYLRAPLYMVPDIGLWEKIQSFALEFSSIYASRDMGYAFTPMAEGYLNFGWAAAVVVPLLMSLSFKGLTQAAARSPLLWLFALSFPLDIWRGEFMAVFLQLLVFFSVSCFVSILCGVKPMGRAA